MANYLQVCQGYGFDLLDLFSKATLDEYFSHLDKRIVEEELKPDLEPLQELWGSQENILEADPFTEEAFDRPQCEHTVILNTGDDNVSGPRSALLIPNPIIEDERCHLHEPGSGMELLDRLSMLPDQ